MALVTDRTEASAPKQATSGSVTRHWIDGGPADGGDRRGPIYNPATGERRAEVLFADVATVDRAVDSAKRAFAEWRDTSLGKRAKVMLAFRELLVKRSDDLARVLTLEHGKVFTDAQGEVARGLEVVEFACGIPHLMKGEFIYR